MPEEIPKLTLTYLDGVFGGNTKDTATRISINEQLGLSDDSGYLDFFGAVALLDGDFTADDLRKIANEIERRAKPIAPDDLLQSRERD